MPKYPLKLLQHCNKNKNRKSKHRRLPVASCRMQYAENVPCNLLFWHFAYSKQFLWSFMTEKSVAMLEAPSCDIFFIVFEPGIDFFFLFDRLEIALLG